MKTKLLKRRYGILLAMFYVALTLFGWYLGRILFNGYLGGVVFAVIGFIVACIVDIFLPRWKYEITWADIDIVLRNIYEYGLERMEFWFRVSDRRIRLYRDSLGCEDSPIRMEVSIPHKDWSDLLSQKDIDEFSRRCVCDIVSSKGLGEEHYFFVTKRERPDDCKAILKYLFDISAGGLTPEIMADSMPYLWIDYEQEKNADRKKRIQKRRNIKIEKNE